MKRRAYSPGGHSKKVYLGKGHVAIRSCMGQEIVDSLTQPESQILAGLQLAAMESVAGCPKQAFDRWVNTIAIAQDRLSGIVQENTFLAIIQ